MSKPESLSEITFRVIILSIVLAIILAASNTYLALKIGILTSASIPAAVLSMAVLRFFKNSTIYENNLVQTAASAGEAVAGGIVYTIPALILIHYWTHFSYFENLAIALCGGILGILFSIPLRRILMTAPHLHFPEGKAIAEILQFSTKQYSGVREMLLGGLIGGLLELAQTGLKVIANTAQKWFVTGNTIFGFGGGFSATLIGAGYLVGFNVGVSILIGAIIVWGIGLPILSSTSGIVLPATDTISAAMKIYGEKIHYIGIGSMLVAGLWTLLNLIKPFYESIKVSLNGFLKKNLVTEINIPRTEQDIPFVYVIIGITAMLICTYFLFDYLFPIKGLNLAANISFPIVLGGVIYILIIGFIFAAICGYFSGLVGVTASPGSAVIIAGMLLAALILRLLLTLHAVPLTQEQLLSAAAITIIVGSVITGAAAIANDNIQDLKVGHIIGATPWKQQVMLVVGVVAAAVVIPPIMQILFNVYGIGNVLPHPGMDPTQTLAAPPAAMMAGLTEGVFNHDLPWDMLGTGAIISIVVIAANYFLEIRGISLSILGVAFGTYFPLSSSMPLFIGSLIALITKRALQKRAHGVNEEEKSKLNQQSQRGLLLACGLVSGAALMDVLLAIPMSLAHSPDALSILPANWQPLATILGFASLLGLGLWFYRVVCKRS